MEIFFYIITFILGAYFGSFFTLAVYRIPKGEDILYKHSYCPNCNHKLGILDLIPILSYIFLGAKCRYCLKKIRPRYILLEIFTGIVFLIYAISQNLYNLAITNENLLIPIIGFLYIAGLFIIAGIDKEEQDINKFVLVYETFIVLFYILTLYVNKLTNIREIIIQISILILLYLISITKTKKQSNTYIIDYIILIYLMYLYCDIKILLITMIFAMLSIGIKDILEKIVTFRKEYKPIGFYLCIANIISIIVCSILSRVI